VPLDALPTDIALDVLRGCLTRCGSVIPTRHFLFLEELSKDGLELVDAWQVIKSGAIFQQPELDIERGDWKYKVEGYTPDGVWLVIVFCLKQINQAVLITAWADARNT
jgi:hypothetical protein